MIQITYGFDSSKENIKIMLLVNKNKYFNSLKLVKTVEYDDKEKGIDEIKSNALDMYHTLFDIIEQLKILNKTDYALIDNNILNLFNADIDSIDSSDISEMKTYINDVIDLLV